MKISIIAVGMVLTLLLLFTGCSSVGELKGGNTNTGVSLNQKNYEVIKPGAKGVSYGFWFLFIPITSPNYADAKENLYNSVGESLKGRAVALANETDDHSSLFLILITIPRVTVTADVIEFTEPNTAPAHATTGP